MIDALYLIIILCSILSWCSVEARCVTNTSCSPHGLCLHGSCFCRSPWGGPTCETNVLFDRLAKKDYQKAPAAEIPVGHSLQMAAQILSSSSPSKPVAMISNMSHPILNSGALKFPQNSAAEDLRLQTEVNDLNQGFRQLTSEMAVIAQHRHDGKTSDSLSVQEGSVTSDTSESSLMNGLEDKPPEHVKNEVDWEVQHSRMAAIHVMIVITTIVVVLFLVQLSEMARKSLEGFQGDDPWEVDQERPTPNIYRAVAVLRPDDIGYAIWANVVAQAVICLIMMAYIPVTLLYQNLITWEVNGLKDYSSISVPWWIGMMLRVAGLFNLVRLFTASTVAAIMNEYKDDWILLSMRRVRRTDKKRSDVLIQFVRDLNNENPARRIAAAIMLRRAAKPGRHTLESSDPEKGESVNVFDALIARLGYEDDEDEDGNSNPKPVETDIMAKCAVCHALGILAGPEEMNVQQVLSDVLAKEENQEVKTHAENALENIKSYDPDPDDDVNSVFWRAWSMFWVSISLLINIVVATFLEVVVLIKIMVLTGSVDEVALIIMAVFFINELDEKVIKGAPAIKKMYWVQCFQQTKRRKDQPHWVRHVSAHGGVPLTYLMLYIGLVMMVTLSWKNRYTGQIIQ